MISKLLSRMVLKGVGLFRTEFLYMESDELPTEDSQYEAYKTVLENVNGPVVVRTMDIGGDKKLKGSSSS